jgi:hypothetical protein
MKEYQIVLANFFTEEKKFAVLQAEDHSELEEKVEALGMKNPEFVVAAYLDRELQLATRPFQMMIEKDELLDDPMLRMRFIIKWRVIPTTGDQIMPDYSLPEDTAIFKKEMRKKFQPIQSAKPVRRTSKGERAPRVEIFQGAAGA